MPDVPGGNVQFSFFLQKEMTVKNCEVSLPLECLAGAVAIPCSP